MSFKQFQSIEDVLKKYPIYHTQGNFITEIALSPSQTFLDDYNFGIEHLDVLNSESARRENIIYPILKEAYKHYFHELSLWNQKSIRYDDVLTGVPDYMVSVRSERGNSVLEKPLMIMIEAKKNDFEQGWGQCLAEMVAAQKLNENPELIIYGVVTDGLMWQFGQLISDQFTMNRNAYTESDMEKLFGGLNYVLHNSAQAATKLKGLHQA